MNLIQAALLGLVQGLTEFLPVSSSGHLVLAGTLLGVQTQGILFEVTVHLATAAAVVLAYRRRIRLILKAFAQSIRPGDEPLDPVARRENLLLGMFVILGTIPAGVIGLTFKSWFEQAFDSPRMVCWMLLATAVILLLSRLAPDRPVRPLRWYSVIVVGLAQAAAIIPGISRSGSTISAGLLLGLGPGRSAEFSFLLALPAILGAGLIEGLELIGASGALSGVGLPALLIGGGTAFISGYIAIFFLLRVLQRGRFDRFAWYVAALGLVGLILL